MTKVVVQEELNRVPCWIPLGTYTNIRWSVHLSPVITCPLLRTIYILHNPSLHYLYLSCIVFLDVFYQVDKHTRNSFLLRSCLITVYLIPGAKYNYFILSIRICLTLKGTVKGRLFLPLPHPYSYPYPGDIPHPWWALLILLCLLTTDTSFLLIIPCYHWSLVIHS